MYSVKSTSPTEVFADSAQQKEVSNSSGGTVYYKTESDVDSEDTALAVGSSVVISQTTYFISASSSRIQVRDLKTTSAEDVSTVDDLTVGDDAEVKGKLIVNETSTLKGNVTAEGTAEVKKTLKVVEGSTLEGAVTAKKTLVVEEGIEGKKTLVVGEKLTAKGEVEIDGELNHDGAKVGFFGTAPAARPKKKAPAEISAQELAEALETLGLLEH